MAFEECLVAGKTDRDRLEILARRHDAMQIQNMQLHQANQELQKRIAALLGVASSLGSARATEGSDRIRALEIESRQWQLMHQAA